MKIKDELERQREIEEMENGMGKRNYVEILSVRTPAGIENNYQDIVGMVLPITGNAYHGIRVVTPDGTERDIFHYNTKINPKTDVKPTTRTISTSGQTRTCLGGHGRYAYSEAWRLSQAFIH